MFPKNQFHLGGHQFLSLLQKKRPPHLLYLRQRFLKRIVNVGWRRQKMCGREMQRRPEHSFLYTIASLLSSTRAREKEREEWNGFFLFLRARAREEGEESDCWRESESKERKGRKEDSLINQQPSIRKLIANLRQRKRRETIG